MKYLPLIFLLIGQQVSAKCEEKPTYLISADILSCEAKYINDGGYSVLGLKVIDEHQFKLYPPFEVENKSKYSIKNKNINVVMSMDEISCGRAMHDKIEKIQKTLIVNKICCDHGQEICQSADYIGRSELNKLINRVKPTESFDEGFNFTQDDVLAHPGT